MESSTRRQIKDIQYQAEQLLTGRPSLQEIEAFDQYNEELKAFLLEHLTEPLLVERIVKIPRILEETKGQIISRGFLTALFAFLTSGFTAYISNRQRIEHAIGNIHEAKGLYSSIEFLSRNIE